MNTLSNPSINRNDLVSLISKSQEYIEILKSIISIEDVQGVTTSSLFDEADSQFSSEVLSKLEEKVSQTVISFESDSSILLELPGKPSVEYNCKQMGFRSQETKTWGMLIGILSSAPHTFNFGIAYTYPDGSKKNRQKCKNYDAKWKLLDELNKKLLMFFKREFSWSFPEGYKLYESNVAAKDGEKSLKLTIGSPSLQDQVPSSDIEKRFLSLDEKELVRNIRALNDDFTMDSYVHSEPPETLLAAVSVGREKFAWTDEKFGEIIQY
ncbi:MAG: hypothetical protein HN668_12570 [Nitrospina sp.]|nr:hypothetical protein [Nitrospina sp.]